MLRALDRDVYAVGHRTLTVDGWRWAAVLAGGEAARLSHGDGLAAWGLLTSSGSRFHVTVPRGARRSGKRGRVHVHVSELTAEDVGVVRGIPVTSVARSIVDHAATAAPERIEEAIDQAITLGLYDQTSIDAQLARARPGTAVVRRVLAGRHPQAEAVKSRWERRMLRLVREAGLPRPEVNAWLADLRCSPDLLWRERRLVVEWDSWEFHRGRAAFEHDRRQTLDLQAAGFTVLRFTWRHVHGDRAWTIGHLRRAYFGPKQPRSR